MTEEGKNNAKRRVWLRNLWQWIAVIAISFLLTTMFVQGTARDQCEDGKPFLRTYISQLTIEAKTLKALIPITHEKNAHELRINQLGNDRALINGLKPAIRRSCAERFPIIPGTTI